MYLSVFVAMGNRQIMQFVFTSFYSIPAQLCHYMDNSLDTHKKNKRGKATPPHTHTHLKISREAREVGS